MQNINFPCQNLFFTAKRIIEHFLFSSTFILIKTSFFPGSFYDEDYDEAYDYDDNYIDSVYGSKKEFASSPKQVK